MKEYTTLVEDEAGMQKNNESTAKLSMHPRVALMILNFNGLSQLKECLPSVTKSTYPNLEIYMVDNASSDASCAFVKSHYPEVKLITFEENLGFAEAYNRAIKHVNADYLVLLNNDTVVEPGFVSALVDIATSDLTVGSVGCRIVRGERARRYGPVFFTGRGCFIGPLFFGSTLAKEKVYSTYDMPSECLANSAAAVLYRKSVIDAIGLFDSFFWADWEDHDLGFRICISGYRNLYTPNTTVLHRGAETFGSVDSRAGFVDLSRSDVP
jgi:GT2 family glycosyltransferase